jgi:hypothetical protein
MPGTVNRLKGSVQRLDSVHRRVRLSGFPRESTDADGGFGLTEDGLGRRKVCRVPVCTWPLACVTSSVVSTMSRMTDKSAWGHPRHTTASGACPHAVQPRQALHGDLNAA